MSLVRSLKAPRLLGLMGILLGLAIWPIDAFIDSQIFYNNQFFESLISPEPVERYMRIAGTLLFMVFGFFAQMMVARQNKLASQLNSAHLALQGSERKFRDLVESSSDWIWEVDSKGVYTYVSPKVEDVLGFRPEEIVGKTPFDLMSKSEEARVRTLFLSMVASKAVIHELVNINLHKDGYEVVLETNGVPIITESGDLLGYRGVDRDITKRLEREKQQRKSEAQLTQMIEQAEDAIISVDESFNIILFNPSAEKTFDYEVGELLGQPIEALIPQRLHKSHQQHIQGFQAGETDHAYKSRGALTGVRKNGEEFPIEASISRQIIDGQKTMTIMLRDISERVKSEALIRQLSTAIQQSVESVIVTDVHSTIEYVNPAFTRITGFNEGEVIGNTPAMLNSGAQEPGFYKELWETILAGEIWHGSLTDRRKNGEYYPALMTIIPIKDESGEITNFVSLQQDMSDYNKLERQFLQAQKMEAMGTLVGGIAHDFNNVIAAIQGNAYLARIKLDESSKPFEKVKNIEQLGVQAGDMVRQLLTFARKDNVEMKTFNLNSFMKETYKLTEAAIPENIEYQSSICSESLMINGDTTQLQQMLMNLLNNGRDALEDVKEPSLCCKLECYTSDATFRSKHEDSETKHYAHIIVSDNGEGIKKDRIEKVFEPFFTTKGAGKGTGLGLAMVYGAVETHQGIIEVESEVGVGTSMHIYLPVMENKEVEKLISNSEIKKGQGQMILLVDDDENVRLATADVLKAMGYQVMEANNGSEALEVYMNHQQEIELIISDIVMPRVGGVELVRQIREMNAKLPVIYITGYDRSNALDDNNQTVISKPFTVQMLSEAIHTKLQQAL